MKIQDLPQPYRALAEMRREQQINSELFRTEVQYTKGFERDSVLKNAFCFNETHEGAFWWYDLDKGNTPEIPAASLEELKEWQNKTMNLQKGQTIWAIDPCEETGGGNPRLTVGKDYVIEGSPEKEIKIKNDFGRYHYFSLDTLDTFFSLTPPHEVVLIAEQPKEEPDPRLVQAALAAMQGMLVREKTPYVERLCNDCWDYAEALINEGKKRGKLD